MLLYNQVNNCMTSVASLGVVSFLGEDNKGSHRRTGRDGDD